MALLCSVGRHATQPSDICNQGLYFSTCRRCGCDMIGSAVKWKPVPRNKQVVWRTTRGSQPACLPETIRNLPMVIAQKVRGKSRLRARFADFVSMDLTMLAWTGAGGLRLWRSKFATRLFEQRSASNGQFCLEMR